jgi:hypothetical protein
MFLGIMKSWDFGPVSLREIVELVIASLIKKWPTIFKIEALVGKLYSGLPWY